MSKYGYLKCKCSDPGSDYIESHEILDVDDTGFTIGLKRRVERFWKCKPVLEGLDEQIIKEEKEWYDENRPDLPYPNWLDHEKYFKTQTEGDDTYVGLFTKERINVPLDFVKEHSNDNWNNGYYIRPSYYDSATDTDKEFRKVLSEWTSNVYWGEEPTNCVTHTWSLD